MARFSGASDAGKLPGRGADAREPGLSIVAVGMHVIGQIDTNGVIKVEGSVEGSVRAERQVLIASGGVVDGNVYTREAIVGGEVRGAIFADERVEVQAASAIHGDITTQCLVVQEGGEVNGQVRMANPDALSRSATAPAGVGAEARPSQPAPA